MKKGLALLTASLLREIPGWLSEIRNLFRELGSVPPLLGARLFSVAVEALYPSTSWKEGITCANWFYAVKLKIFQQIAADTNSLPRLSPWCFWKLLELIIKNN